MDADLAAVADAVLPTPPALAALVRIIGKHGDEAMLRAMLDISASHVARLGARVEDLERARDAGADPFAPIDLGIFDGQDDIDIDLFAPPDQQGDPDTPCQQQQGDPDTPCQQQQGDPDTPCQQQQGDPDTPCQQQQGDPDTPCQQGAPAHPDVTRDPSRGDGDGSDAELARELDLHLALPEPRPSSSSTLQPREKRERDPSEAYSPPGQGGEEPEGEQGHPPLDEMAKFLDRPTKVRKTFGRFYDRYGRGEVTRAALGEFMGDQPDLLHKSSAHKLFRVPKGFHCGLFVRKGCFVRLARDWIDAWEEKRPAGPAV